MSNADNTILWTAIVFGGLFTWCVIVPACIKATEQWCFFQRGPAVIPDVQIDVPVQEPQHPVGQESTAAGEPVPVLVHQSAVKIITSESYDELSLAVARQQGDEPPCHCDEESKHEGESDRGHVPCAPASNIFVMSVVGRSDGRRLQQ